MIVLHRHAINKALARLRARIHFWKRKHDALHKKYLDMNDRLGNALFREQDMLRDIDRLKGLDASFYERWRQRA